MLGFLFKEIVIEFDTFFLKQNFTLLYNLAFELMLHHLMKGKNHSTRKKINQHEKRQKEKKQH
jgi:hypothetical protein